MGSGKKTTVGYYYYLGFHAVLCRGPVDEIQAIYFDEKLAWEGSATNSQQILINKTELFGGDNAQGGVYGNVDLMFGEETQQKNSYLQSKIAPLVPAFRGMLSLVFRSFYISAMTPYLKSPSVKVKRLPAKGWRDDIADINGACNPAHAILEIVTSSEYGLGESVDNCDMDLFENAAQTLYDENFGLSFTINGESSVKDVIQMIMDHVGGIFTTDPKTGLHKIILFRDDYFINSLPLLTPDNSEVLSFERPSYSELCNEIVASYRPRGKFKDDTITLQDIAAIQSQGNVVSQSVSYPAIDNVDLASRVAARDLKIKSTPLAKIKIKTDRRFWNVSMGDVLAFQWPDYSIEKIAIRVIDIDYGNIGEGSIIIEAVEDIFGLAQSSYFVNQESGWVDESQPPVDAANFKLVEAGYWDAVKSLGELSVGNIDPTSAFLMCAMGMQSYLTTSFELWTPTGNGAIQTNNKKEYPLYDLYLTSPITDTETFIPVLLDPKDFYWVAPGSQIVVSDDTNTESMTVVSISSNQLEVEPRTGFFFGPDSYVYAGYGENNPIRIGQDISESDTNISNWVSEPTEIYILEGEYYTIDDEIVLVVSAPGGGYGSTDILRAQKGTVAAPHKTGRFMRRIYQATNVTNQYELRDIGSPAPFCVTRRAYTRTNVSLSGVSFKGDPLQVRIGSYAYWEDEIVEVQYVSESLVIVGRGCLDTVPVDHNSGSMIIFAEDNQAISSYEYLSGETVPCKILPRNSHGVLALSDATQRSIDMIGRFNAPYPPGKFRINTEAYPEVIEGVAALTWAHRDRITQTATLVNESIDDIGPEAGVTYNLRIYGETDTLVHTEATSSNSYIFTNEIEICDLWDETGDYDTAFTETGDASLTGWLCAATGISDYKGRVFLYDGTNFVGEKRYVIEPSPPITSDHSKFIVSSSPREWSEKTDDLTFSVNADTNWMSYGDGMYVISINFNTKRFLSTDLETWTEITTTADGYYTKPEWDGSQFVMTAITDTRTFTVWTSTDLETWTEQTSVTLPDTDGYQVELNVYYLGLHNSVHFIIYKSQYGSTPIYSLLTSTDLVTWTVRYNTFADAGAVGSLGLQVAYCNGVYLIAGGRTYDDAFLISEDAITWTPVLQEDFFEGYTTFYNQYNYTQRLLTDGSYFYFAALILGEEESKYHLVRSADGVIWTDLGQIGITFPPSYAGIPNYFGYNGSEFIFNYFFGDLLNEYVFSSTDTGATWYSVYPHPPSVEYDDTESVSGSGCIKYTNAGGVSGYCKKETDISFDFRTQRINTVIYMKAESGKTPTFSLMDARTYVDDEGFTLVTDFDSGAIILSRRSGNTYTPLTTLNYEMTDNTWYKITLDIIRNKKVIFRLLDTDDNQLDGKTINITGVSNGIRDEISYVIIQSPGKYDEILITDQQQYPRYNASLRFELESERDSTPSRQMINYTVTRDILLP